MAGVIAIMADGIAMYFCGRWNYHIVLMADGIAMYMLECKADVIAFVVDGITTGLI